MKKLIALTMVLIMICVTGCSKPEPTGPQIIPYEDLDEYTLVFTNEGMSLTLDHDLLAKALNNEHKNADLMREAMQNGYEYSAYILETQIIVYNYDNIKDTGAQMTLAYQASLLTDENIEIKTIPNSGYIGDKYPMERMYYLEDLGFEHYGIMINITYRIGHNNRSVENRVSLQGRVSFENKTESSQLPTAQVEFSDTGSVLTIHKNDILSELSADVLNGEIQSLGMMMYTSNKEYQAGTMHIAKCEFDETTEVITLNFEYERADMMHQALLDEHKQVNRELYVELPLTITSGESEYTLTVCLRCEVQ